MTPPWTSSLLHPPPQSQSPSWASLLQVPLSFPHFALHKVKSSDQSLSAVRHSLANFLHFSSSPFFSFPYMYIPHPLSPTSSSFPPPTISSCLPYIPPSFSSTSLSLPLPPVLPINTSPSPSYILTLSWRFIHNSQGLRIIG